MGNLTSKKSSKSTAKRESINPSKDEDDLIFCDAECDNKRRILSEIEDLSTVSSVIYANTAIPARLESVIEADKLSIVIMFGFSPLKMQIRLNDIHTPKILQTGTKNDLELEAATKLKRYIEEFLTGDDNMGMIQICLNESSNSAAWAGRWVGEVFLAIDDNGKARKLRLSQHLLESQFALPYSGVGPRPTWTVEQLQHIIDVLDNPSTPTTVVNTSETGEVDAKVSLEIVPE